jgi:hypothetical protein
MSWVLDSEHRVPAHNSMQRTALRAAADAERYVAVGG